MDIIIVMILPLQHSILYGPINSRRLRKSLGINIMPFHYKLCSFNCVYCHYGLTDVLTFNVINHLKDLPKSTEVLDEVAGAVRSSIEFDYITFSGNGEPTLHPHFGDIVRGVVELRNKYRPGAKIALLSNSTGLKFDEVRKILALIDTPVFKLDVGNSTLFKKINRPALDADFDEIITALRQVEGIYMQTVIMDGNPSNVGEDDLESYFERLAIMKPVEVHIYSLDRPVLNQNIKKVSPEKLEEIAKDGSEKTGITIKPFYMS
jgi:wyosine [tRNA(Phe)-imidazoG37] synthetase (radical SAM superfamily)